MSVCYSSEQARLTDVQELEEMWYRQESEKPIELPSPVSSFICFNYCLILSLPLPPSLSLSLFPSFLPLSLSFPPINTHISHLQVYPHLKVELYAVVVLLILMKSRLYFHHQSKKMLVTKTVKSKVLMKCGSL